MSQTGQEFRDYVVEAFKRTDKDDEIYNATYDAIQFIAQKYPSEDYKQASYSFDITSSTSSRSMPDNCLYLNSEVVATENGSEWQLKQITRDKFQQLYGGTDSDDNGSPVHYCIYGGTMYFGPIPDDNTYTMYFDYQLNPSTAISSSTAVVPFSQINRNMLRQYVLYFLYLDLDEPEIAKQKLSTAEGLLNQIIDNEDKLTDGTKNISYTDI